MARIRRNDICKLFRLLNAINKNRANKLKYRHVTSRSRNSKNACRTLEEGVISSSAPGKATTKH